MTVFVKRLEIAHVQILRGLREQGVFNRQSALRGRTPREFGEARFLEYPLDRARMQDDPFGL